MKEISKFKLELIKRIIKKHDSKMKKVIKKPEAFNPLILTSRQFLSQIEKIKNIQCSLHYKI